VVCPGKDGVFDLIDRQQRMTTLFLTLCAIRDRFEALGDKAAGALSPQIATTSSDAHGRDVFRYRLDLQYEDSGNVLLKIADKQRLGHNHSDAVNRQHFERLPRSHGHPDTAVWGERPRCASLRLFHQQGKTHPHSDGGCRQSTSRSLRPSTTVA
jgi:uncharacterized protein with ParB-like and HNH nuclease domain